MLRRRFAHGVFMFDWLQNGWFLAGGAAILTVVASGWEYVQRAWQQVAGRIVIRVTATGYVADALRLYIKTHFVPSRFGPREYLGWMLHVRPRRRVQLVPMEVTPRSGKMFWQGWRGLWVGRTLAFADDVESGANSRNYSEESLSLLILRGTFDPDRLIIDATEWYNRQVVENSETEGRRHSIRYVHGTAGRSVVEFDRRHRKGPEESPSSSADIRSCLHHRSLTWSFCDLGPDQSPPGTACATLALSAAAERLVEEARSWKDSEAWYKARGIPWRRGWLLHGRPGTGKTALARSIAEDLDLPVFVYDLASLHNDELRQAWSQMLAEVPCMALIEDIDAVFDGRRNVSCGADRQSLTFDCLLNCLDGIQRADGLLVVITTNRLEKIDAALGTEDAQGSTRPGRIDRVVELGELNAAGRLKIARRILTDWPGEWQPLIDAGGGDTAAQFQERCTARALELRYPPGEALGRDCHTSTTAALDHPPSREYFCESCLARLSSRTATCTSDDNAGPDRTRRNRIGPTQRVPCRLVEAPAVSAR